MLACVSHTAQSHTGLGTEVGGVGKANSPPHKALVPAQYLVWATLHAKDTLLASKRHLGNPVFSVTPMGPGPPFHRGEKCRD